MAVETIITFVKVLIRTVILTEVVVVLFGVGVFRSNDDRYPTRDFVQVEDKGVIVAEVRTVEVRRLLDIVPMEMDPINHS